MNFGLALTHPIRFSKVLRKVIKYAYHNPDASKIVQNNVAVQALREEFPERFGR